MPKTSSQSDATATWPIPLLLGGVLLLILGPWAANLIPTGAVWSDEDAREYTRASADLHAKSYEASQQGSSHQGHSHTGGTEAEKAAAKTAFDAIQARRDRAGRWPFIAKYLLQAMGVVACAAGIWGYLKNKRLER